MGLHIGPVHYNMPRQVYPSNPAKHSAFLQPPDRHPSRRATADEDQNWPLYQIAEQHQRSTSCQYCCRQETDCPDCRHKLSWEQASSLPHNPAATAKQDLHYSTCQTNWLDTLDQ